VSAGHVLTMTPTTAPLHRPGELPSLPAGVIDLTHDSRQVEPGWAFACVVGEHADGHRFAAEAVRRGAVALVVERPLPTTGGDGVGDVPQLVVPSVREAMGYLAADVHGHPTTRLTMVGVTGTNGKTTTTHMLAAILRHTGVDTRLIGTLSGTRTTPEATDLQRLLAQYVREQVGAVVMEVSSHALALHRTNGAHFDVAVFTNLGRDHLDLHESMEAYFRAKARLFTPGLSEQGVVNRDDPYGSLLGDAADIPITGFSRADAAAVDIAADRIAFTWVRDGGRVPVTVPIGGRFNVSNALAALTTAVKLGIAPGDAAAGLAHCPPVPGRFELVSDPARDPFPVVVDYAHTADGMVELLSAARGLASAGGATPGRVIVVFGCGGDRDADKRPLMGAAAGEYADVVIVTSDNPRHEDPMAIIAAAVAGVRATAAAEPRVEPDRRTAIGAALAEARRGDVVVIAGKGHETTQTIGDAAVPFDDRSVARAFLEANRGTGR
jgi:UDP-N-acetylmuramoyl-L-alanyl-D-glutamate--2,6-diaminopimelate ligase